MSATIKLQRTVALVVCLTMVLTLVAACGPTPTPTTPPAQPTTPPAAATKPPAPTVAAAPTATPAPKVLRLAGRRTSIATDFSTSTGGGYETMTNAFETLTGVDSTGKVVPAAAEKWQASPDGKQYTFTIRKGMKWTDGQPVTAKDFEYSWKRTLNPKTGARMAFVMYVIQGAEAYNKGTAAVDTLGVKAVDDYTLQVSLKEPAPYLPMMVSMLIYAPQPQWVIEKYGDKWVVPGNIVSNGPYKFESWKPDQEIVLVRNPDYWGPKPKVDKAIWTLFENQQQQGLVAYENNEVDISLVGPDDLERVRKDAKLSKELVVDPAPSMSVLAVDCSSAPFNNPKVRRALSLGIDREKMATALYKGAALPGNTVVPPGIDGHNPAAALKGGIPEAKRLLAEAGFSDGKGFPEVQFATGTDPASKLQGEFIQNQWQTNLGLKVKLNLMESAAFGDWRRTIKTNKTPYNGVVVRGWTADYQDPTDWYNALLDSSADYWDTRWKNDEFDALVRKAAGEFDLAKRKQMYEAAEVILMQDSPVIPLVNWTNFNVVKPYVKGVYFGPSSMGIVISLQNVDIIK